MLELDLVLERFLERRFAALSGVERQRFTELLEEPDGDLLDFAMGRREPPARYRALVEMLRAS